MGIVSWLFVTAALAGQPADATLGWDGVVLTAQDGPTFSLHMMSVARGVLDDTGAETTGAVGFQHVRPAAVFETDQVSLLLQAEMVGGARILDARADLKLGERSSLAIGQLILPTSHAWTLPRQEMAALDRSVALNSFTPARRFGAVLSGNSASDKLSWWAGVYDPLASLLGDNTLHAPGAMARVRFDPRGRATVTELPTLHPDAKPITAVGVGVVAQPVQFVPGDDLLQAIGTADVNLQTGDFGLLLEGFGRWTQEVGVGVGGTLQATYFVLPEQLNVGVRVSGTEALLDDGLSTRVVSEGIAGLYVHDTHAFVLVRAGYAVGGELGDGLIAGAQGLLRF